MKQHLGQNDHVTVVKTTGSEGPTHDPYAWTAYTATCRRTSDQLTLRFGGLGYVRMTHATADGERPTVIEHDAHSAGANRLIADFKVLTGYTPEEWEQEYADSLAKCRKCGGTDIQQYDGMPGESLLVCEGCGTVLDCTFDESAVI